ncbi:MAG: NfeD family protein [Verrucomicrobiae bacterium]|jgi:membrane protein implicated in regulation of membrane protease activity|nr:NfeD family protein [Verrucomicrobiae bacterium]
MSAHTIYLFCLVLGLTFTVLSAMLGHFFGGHETHVDGSGGHVEAGADNSDMPGVSIFSPTILSSFITAFGGFGIIFSDIPATSRPLASAPLSIFAAFIVAGILYWVLSSVFRHTQGSSEPHVAELAGTEASVISPIPENGVGEIAYVVHGSRFTGPARVDNGTAISGGKSVRIKRVVGTQFFVEPLD